MTDVFPATAPDFHVVIIGGGAAGVLVAIHLLGASPIPPRIAIIEPRSALGLGAAYSTAYPEHLLNVIASRMSAFPSDPEHFVRFLADVEDLQPAGESYLHGTRFARRLDFAKYLSATLAAQPGAEQVQWLRDEAIDIERDGTYRIRLRSGANVAANSVVLALGNFAREIPLPPAAIAGEPQMTNAWDYAAIRSIENDGDVCIVGSGLSMVDAVLSLSANQHRGKITVLSRHGLVPLAHATPGAQEGDVGDLLALSLRLRVQAIRMQALATVRAGEPWQWTMDRLRPHVESLWTNLSVVEQKRFLRHAARFWDIHRHRIAPSVARQVEALRASGQLEICAGYLTSLATVEDRLRIRFRPRGQATEREILVDHLINSTGMELNIARMTSLLIQALRKRGLISAGPHGIGIATDATGAVISQGGEIVGGLATLGSLRVGQLWESIAIPELREQAERLAKRLSVSLGVSRYN